MYDFENILYFKTAMDKLEQQIIYLLIIVEIVHFCLKQII